MRKTLSNKQQAAHYWANKVQPEGRAHNVFFHDEKIYSYGHHFCIARHLPNNTVAFTTRGYSPSTSSHIAVARSAASHLRIVWCHNPDTSARDNRAETERDIKANLDNAEKPRIRQTTRDRFKAQALHLAEQFNTYLVALPEAERANVRPFDTSGLEEMRAAMVKEEERLKRKAERDRKAAIKKNAERFQEWKNGTLDHGYFQEFPVALRLTTDRDIVQTSRGAEIPVADAHALWPIVVATKAKGKQLDMTATRARSLGHYTLNTIRADGSIVVGCHDIPYSELEQIAEKLGLLASVTTNG